MKKTPMPYPFASKSCPLALKPWLSTLRSCPLALFLVFSAVVSFMAPSTAPIWAQEAPQRIDLEIFCDGPLQPMAAQEWGAALNKGGFQSVQLRAGDESDALDILDTGAGWRVYGMLTKDGKILLPGGTSFRKGQIRDMKPYLEQKIQQMQAKATNSGQNASGTASGNASSGTASGNTSGGETTEYGITAQQLEQAFKVLAQPVGFETKGQNRKKVLHGITKSLDARAAIPPEILDALDKNDLVQEELKDVSKGTALAYVLRYIGYCFTLEPPRKTQIRQDFTVRISTGENATSKTFPIGHVPEKHLPSLSERFTANIDGASLGKILQAMSQRLNLPILYDYNSMAGAGIDPATIIVKQRPVKISYDNLFDMLLGHADLQKELRIDEAGNPFLWITTKRPVE